MAPKAGKADKKQQAAKQKVRLYLRVAPDRTRRQRTQPQVAEDKTFGLKNKSKSSKVQKCALPASRHCRFVCI
jgi:hypothetical protein